MTEKKILKPQTKPKWTKLNPERWKQILTPGFITRLLCTLWKGRSQQQDTQWTLPFTLTWGDFFQFYISIIFAMCICTARALSFQMASCLLHSGFHLEELFCICLQNWSQLCSSYQSVTWEREVVHALSVGDQCYDPPASRRINLRDKSSSISFSQQSCLEQTHGLKLWWCSWSRAGWSSARKKCINCLCDIKDCPAGV